MNSPTPAGARETYAAPTHAQLADAIALVDRFAAVWSRPDLAGLESLMDPDTRNLVPPMTEPADRAGVLTHFGQVLQQLPDLRVEVIRWAPTGDCVLLEWRAAASVAGRALSWTGVDRFRLRGGRMVEAQVYWDTRRVAAEAAAAGAA
jgi:ketosteroid isomerase-like protein